MRTQLKGAMKPISTHLQAALLLLILTSTRPSHAQDVDNPDAIYFKSSPLFPDLRQCLKDYFAPFEGFGASEAGVNVGCTTNKCLCRADNIAENLPRISSDAIMICSRTQDANIATKVLKEYCVEKGYAVPTGGASDDGCQPTATVTVYVERGGVMGSSNGDSGAHALAGLGAAALALFGVL